MKQEEKRNEELGPVILSTRGRDKWEVEEAGILVHWLSFVLVRESG
jgi:hypothetical protein